MSKKTIGILTFHDGINYGSYLQVYALSNYVKDRGFNVEIINYKSINHWFNEYKCIFRTKNPFSFLNTLRKVIAFKKCQALLPLSSFTFKGNKIVNKRYDVVVVGSDEIWNFNHPIVGFDLTYFGENINAGQLISYAASFGAVRAEEDRIPSEIYSLIMKFGNISVRDDNSFSIIRKIGGKDAELVVDPIFLIDIPINDIRIDEKDFILIYTTYLTMDEQEEVRSYANKTGKKLISVGYKHRWCDKNIVALDPFSFLAYFQKASCIITSMFHGTMFSIKYRKQFCTLLDPYRVNKFNGIMQRINLTHRIKDKDLSLENIFENQIDYTRVNALLEPFIEDSKRYLDQRLF